MTSATSSLCRQEPGNQDGRHLQPAGHQPGRASAHRMDPFGKPVSCPGSPAQQGQRASAPAPTGPPLLGQPREGDIAGTVTDQTPDFTKVQGGLQGPCWGFGGLTFADQARTPALPGHSSHLKMGAPPPQATVSPATSPHAAPPQHPLPPPSPSVRPASSELLPVRQSKLSFGFEGRREVWLTWALMRTLVGVFTDKGASELGFKGCVGVHQRLRGQVRVF